ncbi:hypothetical protein M8J76_008044 [Diaphorina citri]|nr:hypothetical protein M8J75_015623 [Diaphorina citri]KAI5723560.1 hypothetical protein M8J76_008044 [Diaphorina citri]KAI5728954.1 hypothetical protein M8J77_023614 [Diaphorina citri]
MTLKVLTLPVLVSISSIFIVRHNQCVAQLNECATNQSNAQPTSQPKINRTRLPLFDLSRVKNLTRSELKIHLPSIVRTMKKEGRNVLKYFHSSLLNLIFSNPLNEPESTILERWKETCDFFLQHPDVDHFESYVLSSGERFVDGHKHKNETNVMEQDIGMTD